MIKDKMDKQMQPKLNQLAMSVKIEIDLFAFLRIVKASVYSS